MRLFTLGRRETRQVRRSRGRAIADVRDGPRMSARGTSPAGRVCLVRHCAYYELDIRREAEALRDAGLDVDIVCLREPGKPAVETDNGVTLHRLPLARRRGGPLSYVRDYLAFFVGASVTVARLHRQRPFRVVQTHSMPDFLVFTALLPRLRGAKVVAFLQEPTPELGKTKYGSALLVRLLRFIEQAAIRFADLVVTVTDDLKETYVARGADPDKIVVVLNGPDARHLLEHRTDAPPDPAWFTAVCHGFVDERYGHDTMVRAVRLAADRIPNLRLRIMGTGEYLPEVQRLIDEEGVRDRVQYLGWLEMPELVAELCAADVGIVAQKSSPYSNLVHTNKMYEYMLLDVPVVASRLRSTARYFGDDAVQYFEPGSAESLADALVGLHENPDRRRALVAAARERCRAFGWTAQKEIYLAAYAALLGGELPGRREVGAEDAGRPSRAVAG
ncbi:Glycosyltransferase involved in cell wall bisynthesis [Geodermatophilus ruber]|uniref:Glycosyltransferase involved in cell wall bisynthesis n=2 Tax=Geodermatophilus ruber TaxID=504800 RepID=A0A1I4LCY2_9ACTN|nr:Glycosyltransferase involved in cell wall bisynthesis [Geodermatophilus ruber]